MTGGEIAVAEHRRDRTRHNNKISGGNTMSLTKRTARRLSLMAGSSLVARYVNP